MRSGTTLAKTDLYTAKVERHGRALELVLHSGRRLSSGEIEAAAVALKWSVNACVMNRVDGTLSAVLWRHMDLYETYKTVEIA